MQLNENLRSLRNKKGLSQQEVSKLLGINRSTYAHYETGRRQPDPEMIKKFADFYKVTTDYLLGHETNHDCNRSVYDIDGDIAAHLDGKEYSDEAKKSILDFVDFVDSQQNEK